MSLPTLDYTSPIVFCDAVYRCRSWASIIALFMLAFGGSFSLFGAREFWSVLPVRCILLSSAAFWFWLTGHLAVQIITNVEFPVRITEHGVSHWGKFWPWGQIVSLGAIRTYGGVAVEFTPGRGKEFPRQPVNTPAMDAAALAALMETLKDYLARHQPHVKVDPTPRKSD